MQRRLAITLAAWPTIEFGYYGLSLLGWLLSLLTIKLAAWPSGSECRLYNGHNRKIDGSTPTQASLLHPSIRCFTTIISACGI